MNREKPSLSRRELNQLRSRAERLHQQEPAYKRRAWGENFLLLAGALLLALLLHTFVFQIIEVFGPSMEPSFYTGERVVVEKLSYRARSPRRGEVVVCCYEKNGGLSDPIIKRVIALPGETVEIRGGEVYINGEKLQESSYWRGSISSDMEERTVPSGHIFVLGDNRNYSTDSRAVGFISRENIIGRVCLRIWPPSRFGRRAWHPAGQAE